MSLKTLEITHKILQVDSAWLNQSERQFQLMGFQADRTVFLCANLY